MDLRHIDIPKINDEDVFEELCRDLLKSDSKYENVNLHGRSGQGQDGVDVFARIIENGSWIGVQCKVRSTNRAFTEKELQDEISQALNYNPKLSEYYVYTTLSRDAATQELGRKLQDNLRHNGQFKFDMLFWEDIVELLKQEQNLHIYFKYYKRYFYDTTSIGHSIGKLMNLDLGTENPENRTDSHCEIVIGKIPDIDGEDTAVDYYRGMYYIINLHAKKIEFFRIPCYVSDIAYAFENQLDRYRINKWLNRIENLDDFLYDDTYTSKFFISEEEFEDFAQSLREDDE